MKMIYTHENRLIVSNIKNILQRRGFEVFLKNEHAVSVIGEVSAFDSWLELWLVNDSDFVLAEMILKNQLQEKQAADWFCNHCAEENAASFELCWNCGTEQGY
jgi:hypothetical protein